MNENTAAETFRDVSQVGLDESDSCNNTRNKVVDTGVISMKAATGIAAQAADLVGGDRDRQHGRKLDNFSRIARLWQGWLSIRKDPAAPLEAHDVGIMMVLMKLARTQSGSLNIDDYVDACGYAACAGEIAQSD